jgi:hypothetical protein
LFCCISQFLNVPKVLFDIDRELLSAYEVEVNTTFFFGHISLNVPKAFRALRRVIRKTQQVKLSFVTSPQCAIRLRSENRELGYDTGSWKWNHEAVTKISLLFVLLTIVHLNGLQSNQNANSNSQTSVLYMHNSLNMQS